MVRVGPQRHRGKKVVEVLVVVVVVVAVVVVLLTLTKGSHGLQSVKCMRL